MIDDAELLRRYVRDRADADFRELVRRHIDFVYAAAVRQTYGNAALAQDVTQRVFIDLARKAATLTRHTAIVGWLHTATRFTAAKTIRAEARRAIHERDADTWHEVEASVDWAQLQPVIDDALGKLKDRERTAILLRFFEGRQLADVGARLALSENGARSCVERALEKLRAQLERRGIRSTGAAIGMALAQQPATSAPAGLVMTIATHAAAGSAGLVGIFFVMSKLKLGIAAAIIAAVSVPTALELKANRTLRSEIASLQASAGSIAALHRENETQAAALRVVAADNPDTQELLRLRARIEQLRRRPEGVVDSTLKPAATWRNAGWATPEAAMETIKWAGHVGNREELIRRCVWLGDAKAKAEAAFAQLSDVIRARYGTADRLLGEFAFGSRNPENDAAARKNYGEVSAFQVLDTTSDDIPERVRVRVWEELANGEGRERRHSLNRMGDEYGLAERRWSENLWQSIVSQIDPATGAFLPRKIIPLEPVTGRPKR